MPEQLVISKTIAAPVDRVYGAWTTPELMKRWFAPSDEMTVPIADVDLTIGGRYRLQMRNSDGDNHTIVGTYEEIVPNEKLVFSWQWEGSDLVTRVTVALRALAEGHTELTLTHDGFPDAQIRDKHQQGWGGCLGRLERALSEDALA